MAAALAHSSGPIPSVVGVPSSSAASFGGSNGMGGGGGVGGGVSHGLHHLQQQHQLRQQQHNQNNGSSQSDAPAQQQPQQPPRNSVDSSPQQQPRKLQLGDFTRVRTLGTGTFARVCLVRPSNPQTDAERAQVFALKILRKTEVIKLKQIDHVRHERAILAEVSGHPFITNLRASFSDRDFLYLVLDYVPGGELFSYLRKYRRFNERMAVFYAAEIVLVLEYLHEAQGGVAYRDLKPENLLLDEQGHIRLVDFGFAKRLGGRPGKAAEAAGGTSTSASSGGGANGTTNGPVETYTLCGTPEYLAPEVIHNKGHTTAVDWWALGILIYEFLTGYPPFWHQNPIEIYKQIVEKPVVFPQDPPISPEAQDIIRQFCTVDRSHRLGNISGGAARVKEHPFFRGVDWDAVYRRAQPGPIVPPVRYPGDAQCFDIYPEEDASRDQYTDDMVAQYDHHFRDF
ncbi:AGC protein kinase [Gaeumannomyces tritici R3-111a-1]|uniref:AGC protein kinase n=1 Tax=Gaeumannomyces tritici (strain R3-111a-1) TaxID=644352 RepID=J3PEU9_GAET3|nr:AGC protein kinase [Gaeumannomyces tritici R3-111a-1]EJT71007.1 AGC protein kinase [Gaeumannomyces tritici R3-111a-1]